MLFWLALNLGSCFPSLKTWFPDFCYQLATFSVLCYFPFPTKRCFSQESAERLAVLLGNLELLLGQKEWGGIRVK